jgi:hypothetical protein
LENPFEPPKAESVVQLPLTMQPMPTTWRRAAWQGFKFGLKWMAFLGGPLLAIAYCAGLALIIERGIRNGTWTPSSAVAEILKAAKMMGFFLYIFGILCFVGALAGCIIYSLSYASDHVKNKKLRPKNG